VNSITVKTETIVNTKPVSTLRGSCFMTVPELAVVTTFCDGDSLGNTFVNAGSKVSAGILIGSW